MEKKEKNDNTRIPYPLSPLTCHHNQSGHHLLVHGIPVILREYGHASLLASFHVTEVSQTKVEGSREDVED